MSCLVRAFSACLLHARSNGSLQPLDAVVAPLQEYIISRFTDRYENPEARMISELNYGGFDI